MIEILLIYIAVINVITFIFYGVDKKRAVRHRWRIPEKTLILLSWVGGGVGALSGMLIFHHKTRTGKFRILVPMSLMVWALVTAFSIYTGDYYHTGNVAERYMQSDEAVTISKEKRGYLFDGPGTGDLIIFYPGAKVQTEAYAPILHQTAASGYDCYLVNMPFRLAFFGMNHAEDVMADHPDYEQYFLSGHSLGGAMAGNFAAEHPDEISGVIFMAAYPTKSLEGHSVLSLYGSQDEVLNMQHYKNSMSFMPDNFTEAVIEGGNHAQFGDYGKQKGDGEAEIPAKEQWDETVTAIVDFMERDR